MSAQRDFSKLMVRQNERENSAGGITLFTGMELLRDLAFGDKPQPLHTMLSICEAANWDPGETGWISIEGGLSGATIAARLPEPANDIQREYRALDAWAKLNGVVRDWRKLSADWDADDGLVPSQESLDALDKFLMNVSEKGLAPPKPYISSDGEVGLTWRNGDRFATASFLADGRFLAYCPVDAGEHIRLIVPSQQALSASSEFLAAVKTLTERHELVQSL